MKTYTSQVSTQGQVTIPAEVREQLDITPGTVLVWKIEAGRPLPKIVVRTSSPKTFQQLEGALKDMYQKAGGGDKVLKEERDSWE